jgi:hypothetical protein
MVSRGVNMAKVKLSEIIGALELQFDDLSYFMNKETGEVVGIQDEEFRAAEEEEPLEKYPDWQRESIVLAGDILFSIGKYATLPTKFAVNEYSVMERFCRTLEDERLSNVLSHSIRGRGAFRRFKDTVFRCGIQDEWYRFRDQADKEIAIEWCRGKGIEFEDD